MQDFFQIKIENIYLFKIIKKTTRKRLQNLALPKFFLAAQKIRVAQNLRGLQRPWTPPPTRTPMAVIRSRIEFFLTSMRKLKIPSIISFHLAGKKNTCSCYEDFVFSLRKESPNFSSTFNSLNTNTFYCPSVSALTMQFRRTNISTVSTTKKDYLAVKTR